MAVFVLAIDLSIIAQDDRCAKCQDVTRHHPPVPPRAIAVYFVMWPPANGVLWFPLDVQVPHNCSIEFCQMRVGLTTLPMHQLSRSWLFCSVLGFLKKNPIETWNPCSNCEVAVTHLRTHALANDLQVTTQDSSCG